jgi:hypothetical protein
MASRSGTCHGEKIEDAVFAASVGKDLGVDEARIESNVYSRGILRNQWLEPALRLCAVKRMARVASKRMAVGFEVAKQILESWPSGRREFFVGIRDAEENAAVLPAGKSQAPKTKPNFAWLRRRMNADGARSDFDDRIDGRSRSIDKSFVLTMSDKPGIQIARAAIRSSVSLNGSLS